MALLRHVWRLTTVTQRLLVLPCRSPLRSLARTGSSSIVADAAAVLYSTSTGNTAIVAGMIQEVRRDNLSQAAWCARAHPLRAD